MRNRNLSLSKKPQNLGALLGLILLLLPQAFVVPPVQADGPTALIQVNLESESQLKELAGVVQTFYLRLDTPQSGIYILLPADSRQQEALLRSGFDFEVLDLDMRGETYYQLYGLPETLHQAQSFCEFLILQGRQGAVRATPDQVQRLEEMGIIVHALLPHPLIAPEVEKAVSFPSAITPSPIVQNMVAQVSSSTLYSYVGNLSGEWAVIVNGAPYTIQTRYSYTDVPIKKATRFTYEHFESLGLPVSFHYYNAGGFELRNVIAEQSGLTQPQRIFMLIAHLDSTSQSMYTYAPGADDNASGSAAVMAIADVLSQHNFGCTLRYALFTGEEQGLFGSGDYAHDAYDLGENIEGVLNLDMISYNTAGSLPTLELHTRRGNTNDLAIANLFVNAVSAYSIGLLPTIYQDGEGFSDHDSFWDFHFPAIMAIEDWSDHTPYYHNTGDQLETLNQTYHTEFTKAALATFAHMGCLLEGQLSGTVRDAATSHALSGATVVAESPGGGRFSTTTQTDGTYQFVLQPGSYAVNFSAPNHRPATVTGVQVVQNQVTSLDRSLQPCIAVRDADFTFSPYRPAVDETVTFTATVGGGESPISYSWDFGDGSSGSGPQITHAYHAKRGYAARLTANNACVAPSSILYAVIVEAELLYMPLVAR